MQVRKNAMQFIGVLLLGMLLLTGGAVNAQAAPTGHIDIIRIAGLKRPLAGIEADNSAEITLYKEDAEGNRTEMDYEDAVESLLIQWERYDATKEKFVSMEEGETFTAEGKYRCLIRLALSEACRAGKNDTGELTSVVDMSKSYALFETGRYLYDLQKEKGTVNIYTETFYGEEGDLSRAIEGCYTYAAAENGGVKIIGCDTTEEKISLPEKLGGWQVTTLGKEMLKGTKVKYLTIPATVTQIEPDAFDGADELDGFIVDEDNSCYSSQAKGSETGLLLNKEGTVLIKSPNVWHYPCIPDTVTEIADYAFSGSKVFGVDGGKNVEIIGEGAFSGCTDLLYGEFFDSVKTIKKNAFLGCSDLKMVTLPKDLTEIGDNAFAGCTALCYLALQNGQVSIGKDLLKDAGTDDLQLIFFGTKEEWKQAKVASENADLQAATMQFLTPITSVKVDIPYPEAGKEPAGVDDVTLETVPADAASISEIKFQPESNLEDGKLVKDKKVYYYVNISPAEGYGFLFDNQYEINYTGEALIRNGKAYDSWWDVSKGHPERLMLVLESDSYIVIDPAETKPVKSITVSGVKEPVVGEKADPSAVQITVDPIESVLETDSYWYDVTKGEEMSPTDVFAADHEYGLGVVVRLKEGYAAYVGLVDAQITGWKKYGYDEYDSDKRTFYTATEIVKAKTKCEAYGHAYSEKMTKVLKEAGCTEEGSVEKECVNCGEKVTQAIPAKGHSYAAEFTIDKAASATEKGSKSRHCSICGDKTDITQIPATGSGAGTGSTGSGSGGSDSTGGSGGIGGSGFGTGTGSGSGTGTGDGGGTGTGSGGTGSDPGKTPEAEAKSAAKGSVIKPAGGKASYKVTDDAKDPTVEFLAADKKATSVTIPATIKDANGVEYKVTSIAANAFKKNTKLKKLTIGKHVTKIGKNAFNGCKNLKTVTIKSAKLKTVGKNAFKGIHKKAAISTPKSKKKAYTKLLKKSGYKGKIK